MSEAYARVRRRVKLGTQELLSLVNWERVHVLTSANTGEARLTGGLLGTGVRAVWEEVRLAVYLLANIFFFPLITQMEYVRCRKK